MGNILESLGRQNNTEGASRGIIEAIELRKQNLQSLGDKLNGILENSEKRALEREKMQNEKNAQIAQIWQDQSFMNRLQKMDSAKKDALGNILPSEHERINKELEAERVDFYTQHGYSTKKHTGIVNGLIDALQSKKDTQEPPQADAPQGREDAEDLNAKSPKEVSEKDKQAGGALPTQRM